MLVLGIETSCDETAFGLVKDGKLICDAVASQADVHSLFGGVVPELASREHYRILAPLFDDFMSRANVTVADLDAVAVARGPGLLGSLLVGVAFAKALAFGADIPLIGVDHLKAHLLAPGLEGNLQLPALGLLVSGGHTHLYYIKNAHDFILLGKTLDDAAGEAFDKVAKMLGLPYPGGRFLDRLALAGEVDKSMFTYPYVDNANLDFSFSGLKTAVATYIKNNPEIREIAKELPLQFADLEKIHDFSKFTKLTKLCASFNHCVTHTLCIKARRALQNIKSKHKELKSIIVAGGVAANSMLRNDMADLASSAGLPLILPSFSLCTDNGAMIAYAGSLMFKEGYTHALSLEAIPRGRQIPDDYKV